MLVFNHMPKSEELGKQTEENRRNRDCVGVHPPPRMAVRTVLAEPARCIYIVKVEKQINIAAPKIN